MFYYKYNYNLLWKLLKNVSYCVLSKKNYFKFNFGIKVPKDHIQYTLNIIKYHNSMKKIVLSEMLSRTSHSTYLIKPNKA